MKRKTLKKRNYIYKNKKNKKTKKTKKNKIKNRSKNKKIKHLQKGGTTFTTTDYFYQYLQQRNTDPAVFDDQLMLFYLADSSHDIFSKGKKINIPNQLIEKREHYKSILFGHGIPYNQIESVFTRLNDSYLHNNLSIYEDSVVNIMSRTDPPQNIVDYLLHNSGDSSEKEVQYNVHSFYFKTFKIRDESKKTDEKRIIDCLDYIFESNLDNTNVKLAVDDPTLIKQIQLLSTENGITGNVMRTISVLKTPESMNDPGGSPNFEPFTAFDIFGFMIDEDSRSNTRVYRSIDTPGLNFSDINDFASLSFDNIFDINMDKISENTCKVKISFGEETVKQYNTSTSTQTSTTSINSLLKGINGILNKFKCALTLFKKNNRVQDEKTLMEKYYTELFTDLFVKQSGDSGIRNSLLWNNNDEELKYFMTHDRLALAYTLYTGGNAIWMNKTQNGINCTVIKNTAIIGSQDQIEDRQKKYLLQKVMSQGQLCIEKFNFINQQPGNKPNQIIQKLSDLSPIIKEITRYTQEFINRSQIDISQIKIDEIKKLNDNLNKLSVGLDDILNEINFTEFKQKLVIDISNFFNISFISIDLTKRQETRLHHIKKIKDIFLFIESQIGNLNEKIQQENDYEKIKKLKKFLQESNILFYNLTKYTSRENINEINDIYRKLIDSEAFNNLVEMITEILQQSQIGGSVEYPGKMTPLSRPGKSGRKSIISKGRTKNHKPIMTQLSRPGNKGRFFKSVTKNNEDLKMKSYIMTEKLNELIDIFNRLNNSHHIVSEAAENHGIYNFYEFKEKYNTTESELIDDIYDEGIYNIDTFIKFISILLNIFGLQENVINTLINNIKYIKKLKLEKLINYNDYIILNNYLYDAGFTNINPE